MISRGMTINLLTSAFFILFVALAIYFNWHPELFSFSGDLAMVKAVIWLIWLGFLGYSIYCSTRENIFRTVKSMASFHWGRQIGLDLYLGLVLAMFIIFLNEGVVAVLLWLVPTLLFANLSILLYFAIHFEAITRAFTG